MTGPHLPAANRPRRHQIPNSIEGAMAADGERPRASAGKPLGTIESTSPKFNAKQLTLHHEAPQEKPATIAGGGLGLPDVTGTTVLLHRGTGSLVRPIVRPVPCRAAPASVSRSIRVPGVHPAASSPSDPHAGAVHVLSPAAPGSSHTRTLPVPQDRHPTAWASTGPASAAETTPAPRAGGRIPIRKAR